MPQPFLPVIALLAAGCLEAALPPASDAVEASRGAIETRVTSAYQGGAFWPVDPARIEPHLAPGYALAECAEGLGPTALLYVSEREYLDLPAVPGIVRHVFLVTCATPPAGLEHPEPVGEPDWYVLYEASDSDAWIAFARTFGHDVTRADIGFEALGDAGFAFTAAEDGALLARGALASPGLAVPAPGFPFACEPTLSVGRMLRPVANGTYAGDWEKTESTCAGSGTVAHPPDGALAGFLGPTPSPPVVAVVEVHEATHSFALLVDPGRP